VHQVGDQTKVIQIQQIVLTTCVRRVKMQYYELKCNIMS